MALMQKSSLNLKRPIMAVRQLAAPRTPRSNVRVSAEQSNLDLQDEGWYQRLRETEDPSLRGFLLSALLAAHRTKFSLLEAQAQAKIKEAEFREREAIKDLQFLQLRALFAEGLLHMRGAFEKTEKDLIIKFEIPSDETRYHKWRAILDKYPKLKDCLENVLKTGNTNTMARSVVDIYGTLGGHDHHFQSSFDAVDVVIGVVNAQEAGALKCILEANHIPNRQKILLGNPALDRRLQEGFEQVQNAGAAAIPSSGD